MKIILLSIKLGMLISFVCVKITSWKVENYKGNLYYYPLLLEFFYSYGHNNFLYGCVKSLGLVTVNFLLLIYKTVCYYCYCVT